MGYLNYGGIETFEFDDRTLTHLRTVILGKLDLQESLTFTWIDGTQQHSVWIHPSIPLHFEFNVADTPDLDPGWIEQLLALANSTAGLRLMKRAEESAE